MKAELNFVINEPPILSPNEISDLELDYDVIDYIYQSSFIDRRYNDYLKGKSVVIVGPAQYLDKQGKGDWFESFDVIVRFNRSFPVIGDHKDWGTRTDIHYHNMSENKAQGGEVNTDLLDKYDVKFLASSFPKHVSYFDGDIRRIENKVKSKGINFHYWVDTEQYLTFHSILNTRPNIGTSTILDLLNYDIKRLHVSGITFFEDGYTSSYKDRDDDLVPAYQNNGVKNHAQRPQKQLIRLISENNPILTLDDEIKELWK